MNWRNIRLELARAPDFPRGSASRAYLIRLPVNDDGSIDEATLSAAPRRATVRRYWPNEPDMSGHIVPTPRGWTFSYRNGDDDEAVFFETQSFRVGEQIILTEAGGEQNWFRVIGLL